MSKQDIKCIKELQNDILNYVAKEKNIMTFAYILKEILEGNYVILEDIMSPPNTEIYTEYLNGKYNEYYNFSNEYLKYINRNDFKLLYNLRTEGEEFLIELTKNYPLETIKSLYEKIILNIYHFSNKDSLYQKEYELFNGLSKEARKKLKSKNIDIFTLLHSHSNVINSLVFNKEQYKKQLKGFYDKFTYTLTEQEIRKSMNKEKVISDYDLPDSLIEKLNDCRFYFVSDLSNFSKLELRYIFWDKYQLDIDEINILRNFLAENDFDDDLSSLNWK